MVETEVGWELELIAVVRDEGQPVQRRKTQPFVIVHGPSSQLARSAIHPGAAQ
jgi:hypothetical protein